jgi:hypothetical protein
VGDPAPSITDDTLVVAERFTIVEVLDREGPATGTGDRGRSME